jgi:hemoglobin
MVAEYTHYRISQDRRQVFEKAYENAQAYLKASPNCISYELSHCTEEPDRYILRIEWISEERHLKGFRQEPNFKKFFELVQPFISNIEEMQHYQVTEVLGRGGAQPETRSVA